ncbi:hypothetical protein CP883_11035 [Cutibacterium acnes]|nr:hypothetical protein CP883_11035 [Cutibacterium acnes]
MVKTKPIFHKKEGNRKNTFLFVFKSIKTPFSTTAKSIFQRNVFNRLFPKQKKHTTKEKIKIKVYSL